ncbi:MAG TPA: tetratricopeptide repeat protein [Longimicrobiales bacterium]
MDRRLNPILAFTVAAVLAASALPSGAEAQDLGRFRVLIPDFYRVDNADKGFGEDLAKDLRRVVNDLATHQAIERNDIRDMLRRNDLSMEDLSERSPTPCIQTRQLAGLMDAEVAFCAKYRALGNNQFEVFDIQFWGVSTNQNFDVESFTVSKNERQAGSQRIVEAFDGYVQQIRYRQFCHDYAQSSNWEDALRNCNLALGLNPEDKGVIYQRALISEATDDRESALDDYETVLGLDPYDENALQRAGYLATQLGRNDEGRGYYGRYLELNPGAVQVRRRIAYEMARAGDPQGAMVFIQEGLDVEQDPGLLEDYGNYAFAAADMARREVTMDAEDGGAITPEVAALYREASRAYLEVFEAMGDETSPGALQNVLRAMIQLEELEEAVTVGRQFLDAHADEAGLWAIYADALQKTGDVDAAIQALSEVERLDPDYPNLYARQGNWLLQADQVQEAVPFLQKAVEQGQDPNVMARMILARAHSNGIRRNNYGYAIGLLELAKESFQVSPEQLKELNFYHGYSIYMRAVGVQESGTIGDARGTLPQFQRALQLFQQAQGFGVQQNIDVNQYVQNTNTYIQIQEAIIKRAGGLI